MICPEKYYLCGLMAACGELYQGRGEAKLSFDFGDWGDIEKSPGNAVSLTRDFISTLGPKFLEFYKLNLDVQESSSNWYAKLSGDLSVLATDLQTLGFSCNGKLFSSLTDRNSLLSAFLGLNSMARPGLIKEFLSGIIDGRGSANRNHRKFNAKAQMVAIQFPANVSWEFMFALCQLFREIGIMVDQLCWNHPNYWSGTDAYYSNWSKGIKLRIVLGDVLNNSLFRFGSKGQSFETNAIEESASSSASPCEAKTLSSKEVDFKAVSAFESDPRIPENLRGYHFMCGRHICAALGCPRVSEEALQTLFTKASELICPYSVKTIGTIDELQGMLFREGEIHSDDFQKRIIVLSRLLLANRDDSLRPVFNEFEFSTLSGYPVSKLLDAIASLLQKSDDPSKKSNRVKGNCMEYLNSSLHHHGEILIEALVPRVPVPLFVSVGGYAGLIGPRVPSLVKGLISFPDSSNKYLMKVRKPTRQELLAYAWYQQG